MIEFRECLSCASKSGSPTLCDSCLHNRQLASDYKQCLDDYDECYKDLLAESIRANKAEKKIDELKPRIYQAFQYGYGYRDHPSMRGSSLAAAWTSFKEYLKS